MSTQVAAENRVESTPSGIGPTLVITGSRIDQAEHNRRLTSLLDSKPTMVDAIDLETATGPGHGAIERLRSGEWSCVVVFVDGSLAGLRALDRALSAAAVGGVRRFITVTSDRAAEIADPDGAALSIAERLTAASSIETRACYLSVRLPAEGGQDLFAHALREGSGSSGTPAVVLSGSNPGADTIAPGGGDEIFVPTDRNGVWLAHVAPLYGVDIDALDSEEAVVALAAPSAPAAMEVLLAPPLVGDEERTMLIGALESGWIAPAGPDLNQFELDLSSWVDGRDVVALSSGSAALHLALLVLGVEPGDDVVVQTATFAASAFAVSHAGANPVFCDVDAVTGNLDPELLAELLAERARTGSLPAAVIPVDLYGLCADYERIRAVCEPYGVPIVQDSAESLGSRSQGVAAGAHGDIGVLSFNGNKIITTSGGGALAGPSDLVARARRLSTQAREPGLHYEHAEIGYNFRMSNLLAAVGRAQLASLDERVEHRSKLYDRYQDALPELTWMPPGVTERWNHWLSVAFLPSRLPPHFACRELAAVGVEARPFWKPMHRQPVYAGAESWLNGQSDSFYAHGICLPSGPGLDEASQDRVIERLSQLIARSG